MDILNSQILRQKADTALRRGREPKKVILAYALVCLALPLLVTAADLWMDNLISDTGGLGNMGTRAAFSTVRQILPLVSGLIISSLQLGYLHAMMRISRGQYADQTDLKMGFQLFFPMLRLILLQCFIYIALSFLCFQISYMIFMISPLSEPLRDSLMPLVESGTLALDAATLSTATELIGPLFLILGIMMAVILTPWIFRFRMANYALLDDPRHGAAAALRASRKMMYRKFGPMLRLDLSLWPYYLMLLVTNLVLYGDLLLPYLGVSPVDSTWLSLIFYVLALLMQFGIQMFMLNRVETTYLMAYEQLREKPSENGVVLGNIFDP